MESDIAWEDCLADLPLDTKNLPPLNALSATSSTTLPDLHLLDLFSSFDPTPDETNAPPTTSATSPHSPTPSDNLAHNHSATSSHATPPPFPRFSTPPPTDTLSPVTSSSPAQSASPSFGAGGDGDGDGGDVTVLPLALRDLPPPPPPPHMAYLPLSNASSVSPPSSPSPPSSRNGVRRDSHMAECNSNSTQGVPSSTCSASSVDPQHKQKKNKQRDESAHVRAGGDGKRLRGGGGDGKKEEGVVEETKQVLTDQSQLVLELSTRLASAGAEAKALRKRVAALTAENRSLRGALDHANARLIAVAHAAVPHAAAHPHAAHPHAHAHAVAHAAHAVHAAPQGQQQPVMLGMAQMTSNLASNLAGALTVSDTSGVGAVGGCSGDDSPRERKKRKRMTGAATTMACVMFMWGALVGTPGWLSSSTSVARSEGNLPAVWKGERSGGRGGRGQANVPVPSVRTGTGEGPSWQPNCMRVLEQLPDGSDSGIGDGGDGGGDGQSRVEVGKTVKGEPMLVEHEEKGQVVGGDGLATDNKMFVDVEDKAAASVVSRADSRDPRHPQYSYVLCRDAQSAIDNVKSCTSRMRRGEPCGVPHTISLILPAEAAGLDDDIWNDTETVAGVRQPALAEVQCSITSVARIPVETATATTGGSSYGKIIATVPEMGTVVQEH